MRQYVNWGALSAALAALIFAHSFGCADGNWGSRRKLPPEATPTPEGTPDLILRGTIGEKVVLSGAGPLHVRGFGLVIRLPGQGSTECPAALRDFLIEHLTKDYKLDAVADGKESFSSTKLVDSPDTAAVEVNAFIPAGAPRGSRFDVYVRAAGGTQTRSLEGGLLLPCDLKIVDLSYTGDRLIAGRTIGRAGGPVFTNPYASEDGAEALDPRDGFIIGGGVSLENRNMRLVMTSPSYADTRRIEFRINERFGQSPKTAEAMGEGHVEVHTPAGYADDPMRFIRLVSHVQMDNQPAIYEERLRTLAEMAEQAAPPYEDMALAWEGIGRVGVSRIQPLYRHANPEMSFVAAQAGLRLSDFEALGVMGQIVRDAAHPRRLEAVNELGRTHLAQAVGFLVPLLDSADPDLRIAAYEALLKHRHPSVRTRKIPSVLDPDMVNFSLDLVATSGEPMIYIRRSGEARIAVFGARASCEMPLFYSHPDGWVTLNATESVGEITMFRRTRRTKQLSDELHVAPRVSDLIISLADLPIKDATGRIRGIGLGYSQVVYILHALKREDIILASVIVERSGLEDRFREELSPERPEGDLPVLSDNDFDVDGGGRPAGGDGSGS